MRGHKKGGFHLAAKHGRYPKVVTELDAAKTALRQRGYIVFDAEVTEGIQWRGWIKCDHHVCTPDQILAMAADIQAAP